MGTLPKTMLGDGLVVSVIGFGGMALTPVYGEVDDAESLATLQHCLDVGVTFIDTANVYGGGSNERLISRVLADRRDEVTLATKFGIDNLDVGRLRARGDAGYVRQCLDDSLGADRGNRRSDGRTGRRGQGPPPRPLGGDRRRTSCRGGRAPDRGGPE